MKDKREPDNKESDTSIGMNRTIKDELLSGEKKIAVWGAGFIGATTAMAFAGEGVKVLCYDINPKIAEEINRGHLGVANLEFWFGASMKDFTDRGLITAVNDWSEMSGGDIAAHFIAVPTEKDGEPWFEAVESVFETLKKCDSRVAVIESTLVPGQVEKMCLDDFTVCVAPRRDWFHSPDKNLRNLERVFAVSPKEKEAEIRDILSIVCDHLVPASTIKTAELVKCVENSLLHVPAVFAIQLAHAYPGIDVREVLDLASTHWRIPLYYPSFGTGGYCVPLSSKYVLYGAECPDALTIIHKTIETDSSEPLFVAGKAAGHACGGPVAIMGISYKGDLKVCQLSPAISIARRLIGDGTGVFVHDPFYTHDEARDLIHPDIEWFEPGKTLGGFKVIVLVTDHKVYKRFPLHYIQSSIDSGTLVMDNYGIWRKYKSFFDSMTEKEIIYNYVGCSGWSRSDK